MIKNVLDLLCAVAVIVGVIFIVAAAFTGLGLFVSNIWRLM